MGIRHCRKIELGGGTNICGMMDGRIHYTAPIA